MPKTKAKKTYRSVTIGKRSYKTCSNAIRYYLKNSKYSQSEIAKKVGVTPACVCQLANS